MVSGENAGRVKQYIKEQQQRVWSETTSRAFLFRYEVF